MRIVSSLPLVPLMLCLLTGAGCSQANDSSGDNGDGSGRKDTKKVGDAGTNLDSDPGGTAGDSDSDTELSTEWRLNVLDHDDCQIDYAPASLTSYEADGRFVGLYNFIYDDAGNLVRFMDQTSVLVEYEFEYEETRLVKTTRTVNEEQTGTYEATYEYNDDGLPQAVKGRDRESADAPWRYSGASARPVRQRTSVTRR
jgi:hypothetical protein